MHERLTEEELACLKRIEPRSCVDIASEKLTVPTGLWTKLLAAAEENERLRAAIERHKATIFNRDCGWYGWDEQLWEVLK